MEHVTFPKYNLVVNIKLARKISITTNTLAYMILTLFNSSSLKTERTHVEHESLVNIKLARKKHYLKRSSLFLGGRC